MSNKILENLKKHNEQAAHREIIAAHKAKVEAARAAGPSDSVKFASVQNEMIVANLRGLLHEGTDFTFEPMQFYEREITIEEGTVYGQYGWSVAHITFPKGYYINVSIDEVYTSSTWRSRATGKHNLFVGGYGDRKLFKELKAGGFKYYEIAQELMHRYQGQKNKLAEEAKRKANVDNVKAVIAALDHEYRPYNAVTLSASSAADKPVIVKVECTRAMTVEAATELLNLLHKHGIG